MPDYNEQPEQKTDDLIAGRLAAGHDAGKIIISEGFETVVDGNEGTRAGYPPVEQNRIADVSSETSSLLRSLMIKPDNELTDNERSFIGTVADLGSRTISYALEKYPGLELPKDEEFSEAAKGYSRAALRLFQTRSKAETGNTQLDEATMEELRAFGSEVAPTTRILNKVTGTIHDVGQDGEEARVLVEDFAGNAVTMLDKLSAVNPRIDADAYIKDNLDSITAQMQRAQQGS
jgi:hypothetical protein